MKNEKAIMVNNISKKYRLGQTGYRTLREDIIGLFKRSDRPNNQFWALNDVSFELKKGESLGIIGANGAGKSTMLKILAGVTNPSGGEVKITGKIGAMIELTAGFHSELTGRENIYLYGSIIGLKNEQIKKRFDEIVEFSGLARFLDTPIKKYSSGMYARLGFSVTAHLDPDILLIDEVLSVGDFTFQNKCINKMNEYKNSNVSIIFISHNMDSVRKLCDRTILLDKGRILKDKDTNSVIDEYYRINSEQMKNQGNSGRMVEIIESKLLNMDKEEGISFRAGDKAIFKIRMAARKTISDAAFSVFIRKNDGLVVFDVSSGRLNNQKYLVGENQILELCFEMKINLLKGLYHLGYNLLGSVENGPLGFVEYKNNAHSFLVKEDLSEQGIAYLDARCSVEISN